ncbi:PREDICTED: mitochondrial import inner membrane translocase subunit TIM17-1-like [Fragaria vesca subsp. vesca]|uniref:mitochondrial import inner membrane translocase subunit TIM17-1-like n=1 Tax=Fragaria vesca subsp. vesca TaxID=101020 RepID=UPI0002C31543|nr:PREDICTED: mitochondrial import inner membrane translocase subunit TIM17-1-like [Fragaria vesca subsp. vesca]
MPIAAPICTFSKKRGNTNVVVAYICCGALNTIISAAAATGYHKMRQGLGASARSATMGGILMAFIKGSVILYDKFLAEEQHRVYKSWAEKQRQIWFRNGKHPEANEVLESFDAPQRKEPETAVSSGSETEVLESFDAHLPQVGVLSKPAAD